MDITLVATICFCSAFCADDQLAEFERSVVVAVDAIVEEYGAITHSEFLESWIDSAKQK
jgi:hypothetical protein